MEERHRAAKMDMSQRTQMYNMFVKRAPIGVLSFVSPFNFPLNLTAVRVRCLCAVDRWTTVKCPRARHDVWDMA